LGIKKCSYQDHTEEGKLDIFPRGYKIGEIETQAKIVSQTKLYERTGEKEIYSKIRFWEDFLEGSFELDVKRPVSFLKVEAEAERQRKEKGTPCRKG